MPTIGVKEISKQIEQILANDKNLKNLNIEGEISGYKEIRGHAYFIIKEDDCSLYCRIFNYKSKRIPFTPQDGMKVICKGYISTYYKNGRSDYQLICTNIEEHGEGKLKREFEELKLKLTKEGIFDDSKKKSIPRYPRKIGLTTADGSHAYSDLCKVGKNRYLGVQFVVSECKVQGKYASASIINALKKLDNDSEVDVIVLARGGGSPEELHCFNDEKLIRYIASMKTPIVTGIGHERDTTIADLVADLRASTPSDAITKVVISQIEEKRELKNIYENILNNYKNILYKMHEDKNNIINDINKYNIEGNIKDQREIIKKELKFIYTSLDRKLIDEKNKVVKENDSVNRFNISEILNKNKQDLSINIEYINKRINSILNHKTKDISYLNLNDIYSNILNSIKSVNQQATDIVYVMYDNLNTKLSNIKKDINLNSDIDYLVTDIIRKYRNDIQILDINSHVYDIMKKFNDLKLDNENSKLKINSMIKNITETKYKDKSNLIEDIYNLGPDRTLKRGYSIIMDDNGDIINNSQVLTDMNSFEIKFFDETVKVYIKSISKGGFSNK